MGSRLSDISDGRSDTSGSADGDAARATVTVPNRLPETQAGEDPFGSGPARPGPPHTRLLSGARPLLGHHVEPLRRSTTPPLVNSRRTWRFSSIQMTVVRRQCNNPPPRCRRAPRSQPFSRLSSVPVIEEALERGKPRGLPFVRLGTADQAPHMNSARPVRSERLRRSSKFPINCRPGNPLRQLG